ncbi:MAG TPA: DNA circularization N-terminal domain-containing protein [Elusimicrobiales bacterium]|nr:DNA circularization N-terminal domain-containing protein [Elusimicrobiales bacterium]
MTEKFQLNGIELDAESLSDEFSACIARYEFPYRNGAELEHMGRKARTVKLRCYFYDERYEEHKQLLALLNSRSETVELLHPKYGLCKGQVETVSVRHDDRIKTAEIDLTFIEHLAAPIQVFRPVPASQLSQAAQKFAAARQLISKVSRLPGQLKSQVEGLLESAVSQFEDVMGDVALPAGALSSSLTYATDLPGRLVQSVAGAVERYAYAYEALKTAPEMFTAKLKASYEELESAFALFGTDTKGISKEAAELAAQIISIIISSAAAVQLAYETDKLYDTDQEARAQAAQLEQTSGFDVSGAKLTPEAVAEYMNVRQLERTLADVMGSTQAALDLLRAEEGYTEEIALLLESTAEMVRRVNETKLEREKIIQVTVNRPTHLFLVLQKNGLPYTMAARVLAINNIQNPNEVCGTINIYAR